MVTSAEALRLQYNVSRESWSRLEAYVGLLDRWRQRINLIGPSSSEEIWTRHVADAAQLLPLVRPQVCTILDLGSGSGIPGMVLAIMLRDLGVEVHLVESNVRKAGFLREAARISGANAHIHPVRAERIAKDGTIGRIGLVTARGVAPLDVLLGLSAPWVRAGAYCLFHKGEKVGLELTQAMKLWKIEWTSHPSFVDPRGCILEIKDIRDV